MKRLVICCDGTWNTPDQTESDVPAPTNVVKIHNAVADQDAEGIRQMKYYHPGVGTDPGLWSRLAGGGLGLGLDGNIMSAYRFLADHYESGDEIYLFGFSRGAYTVRSVGGMMGRCGLLDTSDIRDDDKEAYRRVHEIYDTAYRKKLPLDDPDWKFHSPPAGPKQVPIRFIGVWDTVGALGIPDDLALLNLLDKSRDYTFHDTELGENVQSARHAVALDERRGSFQPTMWTQADGRDVKQLWFPGVHSDVGGGYADARLSDGALLWMIEEARGDRRPDPDADGPPALAFNVDLLKQLKPSHHGVLHDSLKGPFSLLPTQPRSAPRLVRVNNLGSDSRLHQSAALRHGDPPIAQMPYRPTRILGPGDEASLDVFAVEPWNETGLYLEAGVEYEMSATGEWVDKSVTCGPGGTKDGKFQLGEIVHLVGTALGKSETLFKSLGGNESANFLMTKRHEEYPWFCLVGAVANGDGVDDAEKVMPHETKKIGTGCRWKPKTSGYLYAYANDAWRFYKNNRGRVRLTVSR